MGRIDEGLEAWPTQSVDRECWGGDGDTYFQTNMASQVGSIRRGLEKGEGGERRGGKAIFPGLQHVQCLIASITQTANSGI